MANYATLKAAISAVVKENGYNEITGNLLQQQLLAMVNSLGFGYQYAGIATQATNPGTPDQNVFYFASTAGTYANFGGLVLADGEIAILKYNGAWSKDSTGAATQESVNQLGQQVIYDVTLNNNNHPTFASLSALLSDANLSTLIPIAVRCGGMSIRFVQSSDNKYVQARLMANTFTTDVTQWQSVDDEPTAGSENLVKSGGVKSAMNDMQKDFRGIYKTIPQNPQPPVYSPDKVFALLDLSIANSVSGYVYYITAKYQETRQVLQVKRTTPSSPSSYDQFVTLWTTTSVSSFKTGVQVHEGDLPSGEHIIIMVDWDEMQYSDNEYQPNNYVLKDEVFTGGIYFEYLRKVKYVNLEQGLVIDNLTTNNPQKILSAKQGKELKEITDKNLNPVKELADDLSINKNIISGKDFVLSDVCADGSVINQVGTLDLKSYLKANTTGAEASWQGYCVAFISKEQLQKRGCSFDTNNYIKTHLKAKSGGLLACWLVLRYGNSTDKHFDAETTGDDVIFNINGGIQGLGTGDTSTWADANIVKSQDQKECTYNNILIPNTYNGKQFQSLLICVGTYTDGNKEFESVYCTFNPLSTGNDAEMFFGESDYEHRIEILEDGVHPDKGPLYAACGDSITNANNSGIEDVSDSDEYCPFDGTTSSSVSYKKKNYAYYIAKHNRLQWASYGCGGSTLTHCAPKAIGDCHGFVDTRIENLMEGVDWDYISIFFGWNDASFNPIFQRDKWLTETYGVSLGYPITNEQIGASGFANAEQKHACDNATGTVGGVEYTQTGTITSGNSCYKENNSYHLAKFIGTIDDNTKDTWCGAWNYALDYLMKKYTKSKILVIIPYFEVQETLVTMREKLIAICEKYGVHYFDISSLPYWYYKTTRNETVLNNPNDANGRWYTELNQACMNTVDGYNMARFSRDMLHPSNLGYQTLSAPIGNALINL